MTEKTTVKRIGGQSCAEHLLSLVNEQVTIVFCDGEVMEGTLIGVGTYNLLVRQAKNLEVLAQKGAVKYLYGARVLTDNFERAKADYQKAKTEGADQVELERLAAIVVKANKKRLGADE